MVARSCLGATFLATQRHPCKVPPGSVATVRFRAANSRTYPFAMQWIAMLRRTNKSPKVNLSMRYRVTFASSGNPVGEIGTPSLRNLSLVWEGRDIEPLIRLRASGTQLLVHLYRIISSISTITPYYLWHECVPCWNSCCICMLLA